MRTLEQKVALLLGVVSIAYGFHSANRDNERRKQITEKAKAESKKNKKKVVQKIPPSSDRIVDHPMFVWFLENLNPTLGAYIVTRLDRALPTPETNIMALVKAVVLNCFSEESSMLYMWFLDRVLYKHIPYFAKPKWKELGFMDLFKNWSVCNLPTIIFVSLLEVAEASTKPAKPVTKTFRPLMFLLRLAIMRVITDLLFYVGHYLIHLRKLYFLHKKHHEHNVVRLETNYQFDAIDLTIESIIPAISAVLSLAGLGLGDISKYEKLLLFRYIFQLEIVSHIGKPVQFMTTLPPLGMWTRKWDDWNSWFHATHHRLLKCNYSITPYWDYLFGTLRL